MEIRIKRGVEEYGPYSPEEARSYLGEGRLVPDDLASADGAAWQPLGGLLGIAPPAPSAARPPAGTVAGGRYPPAPIPQRFGAALLDTVLAALLLAPGLLALASNFDSGYTDYAWQYLIAGALLGGGYLLIKDGFGGRSIGKRATGLLVVHLPSNEPCGVGRSIARMLVVLLANVLPGIGWLIEPIMVIATADRRRLGDRAASTQVIREADYRP